MIPYENIFGFDRDDIVRKAEQTMSTDWTAAFFSDSELDDSSVWEFDDAASRSQNYHAHGWAMLDTVLAAHSATADPKFLLAALEVANDWITRFSSRKARAETVGAGNMAWYDMAVGLRAFRLAYIIDAARHAQLLEANSDRELWQSLLLHADYLRNDDNIKFHNNHGFYQAAGQLAMGRRFAEISEEMAAAWKQGASRFDAMLHQQFSLEGVHLEHSPDYHRMVYRTARAMVDAGLVEDARTIAFLDQVEKSLSWFIMPSGHIANIGDSDSHYLRVKPQQAMSQWHTEEMRYVVSNGEVGSPPSQNVVLFAEAGYAAARFPAADGDPSKSSYLLQQAAFHSRTHKHADTMGFLWNDRGSRILVDAGRYGYVGKTKPGTKLHREGFWYSDPYRVYCEKTRAHNCLEFDGRDYPRRNVKPFGSAIGRMGWDAGHKVMAIETHARHFDAVNHCRLLFFCPSDFLICLDWFNDDRSDAHDTVQWFHFEPAIEIRSEQGDGYTAILPHTADRLQVLPMLKTDGSVHVRGQTEPVLQGWWSRGNRKIDPNCALGFSRKGIVTGAQATLFQFGDQLLADETENVVSEDGRSGSLSWTIDTSKRTLAFERPRTGALIINYHEG